MSRPITWASVEASAAIVSACLPTLRPLLARMFHTLGIPIWVQNDRVISTPTGSPAIRGDPSIGPVTKLYRHYDSNLESLLRPEEELGIPEVHVTTRTPNKVDDGLSLNDIRVDKGVHWEVSEPREPRPWDPCSVYKILAYIDGSYEFEEKYFNRFAWLGFIRTSPESHRGEAT